MIWSGPSGGDGVKGLSLSLHRPTFTGWRAGRAGGVALDGHWAYSGALRYEMDWAWASEMGLNGEEEMRIVRPSCT